MAIRFQCGSCSQPIEVDDEWASKTVVCPYCQRTITAPADSTLTALESIPTAAPLGPGQPPVGGHGPAFGEPQATTSSNALAVVAGVSAIIVVVLTIAWVALLSSHGQELTEMQQRTVALQAEGKGYLVANQQATAEMYEKYGGAPPGWMMGIMLILGVWILAWLATLVCGIIAVLRPQRRGISIAALVVAGLTPVFFCCGAGLGFG